MNQLAYFSITIIILIALGVINKIGTFKTPITEDQKQQHRIDKIVQLIHIALIIWGTYALMASVNFSIEQV